MAIHSQMGSQCSFAALAWFLGQTPLNRWMAECRTEERGCNINEGNEQSSSSQGERSWGLEWEHEGSSL